jgi:hypothetical protein
MQPDRGGEQGEGPGRDLELGLGRVGDHGCILPRPEAEP